MAPHRFNTDQADRASGRRQAGNGERGRQAGNGERGRQAGNGERGGRGERGASDDEGSHESCASETKHWVRVTTACCNRCLFCLDADSPRGIHIPASEVRREIDRGREELGATRLVLSGGEATLHPEFVELVRYARGRGYARVQIVTNGRRLADRDFFAAAVAAGLGEITFSLHGPDAELHDSLTRRPGSFKRLVKAMVRAVRDRRLIVNVDVVINRLNVAVLPQIIERCVSLGVTEFDLLHLIPQGAAFDHRADLFYDVAEHLPTLQQVFRLGRHPRLVVWTNRFPAAYLEGLEDLIQDPSKIADELHGRRYQLRRYLDLGEPLDCRDPERCPHCFIEPMCTTIDRIVAAQHRGDWDVWWTGRDPWEGGLPFGCRYLGVHLSDLAAAAGLSPPAGAGLYVEVDRAAPLPTDLAAERPVILVARDAAALDAWLGGEARLPAGVAVDVLINRRTAPWLVAHREQWQGEIERVTFRQPAHEQLSQCATEDVEDLPELFRALDAPVRVSGLPACLAPGAQLVGERKILRRDLFEAASGRLAIRELGRHHIVHEYRAKSVRCAQCPVDERCAGAHINLLRHRGFRVLEPLSPGPEAETAARSLAALVPEPRPRLATGRLPERAAPSLPGYPMPQEVEPDPLAVLAEQQLLDAAASTAATDEQAASAPDAAAARNGGPRKQEPWPT